MGLESFAKRMDRRASLMRDMFDRLGIDLPAAARRGGDTVLRRALRNCLTCRATVECGAWLRSGGTCGDRRLFCPNAELLERLRDEPR
jgi:hypothetical protein